MFATEMGSGVLRTGVVNVYGSSGAICGSFLLHTLDNARKKRSQI